MPLYRLVKKIRRKSGEKNNGTHFEKKFKIYPVEYSMGSVLLFYLERGFKIMTFDTS